MADTRHYFLRFKLIVTGDTERSHLPKLLRAVPAHAPCSFSVERKIGQLTPRGTKRKLTMVGGRKRIPSRDESIGIDVSRWIRETPDVFVLLIDDIEHARRPKIEAIFQRYRDAVDLRLKPEERHRVGVHFLANMLEAYYFAHAEAVNQALGLELGDFDGDVETIRNPKGKLKQLFPGFREVEHGGRILDRLKLAHVLGDPATCAWLRALVGWICSVLDGHVDATLMPELKAFETRCHLEDGIQSPITRDQAAPSR